MLLEGLWYRWGNQGRKHERVDRGGGWEVAHRQDQAGSRGGARAAEDSRYCFGGSRPACPPRLPVSSRPRARGLSFLQGCHPNTMLYPRLVPPPLTQYLQRQHLVIIILTSASPGPRPRGPLGNQPSLVTSNDLTAPREVGSGPPDPPVHEPMHWCVHSSCSAPL